MTREAAPRDHGERPERAIAQLGAQEEGAFHAIPDSSPSLDRNRSWRTQEAPMRRTLVITAALGLSMVGLAGPAHADKGGSEGENPSGPSCVGQVANYMAQVGGPNGTYSSLDEPGVGNIYLRVSVEGRRGTSVHDL